MDGKLQRTWLGIKVRGGACLDIKVRGVVLDELDLDSLVKLDLTDQGQGPRMKPS